MTPFEKLRKRLLALHKRKRLSWREIANLKEYQGVPHMTLYDAAMKNIEPKRVVYRNILKLPEIIIQKVYREKGRFAKKPKETV